MFPLHCQLSNIGDLDEDTGTRGKVADTHCKDILESVCVCVWGGEGGEGGWGRVYVGSGERVCVACV